MSTSGNHVDVRTPLPCLLRHWARTRPDRLALREKDRGVWKRTTWAAYEARVRDFAIGLEKLGFMKGDRLAIAGEDTPEWIIADLAAQALGGVTVGIYPTNPWPELQYIVRHSRSRFVVCGDQEQVDKVLDASENEGGLPHVERIVCIDMKGMRGYDDPRLVSFESVSRQGREALGASEGVRHWNDLLDRISPDDVSVIVYTSGTTGPPKGAQLTHYNLMFCGDNLCRRYGLGADNYTVLCYLPLCHVAERVISVVLHLQTGGNINFAESIDTVYEDIREIGPTVFLGVPRIWEKMRQSVLIQLQDATWLERRVFEWVFRRTHSRLVASERKNADGRQPANGPWARLEQGFFWLILFRSLQRHMGLDHSFVRICGGASVGPETLRFFEVLGLPVYQVYGLTESGGMIFTQDAQTRLHGCAGCAIDGIEYRIEEDGELIVRGPNVFAGYLFDAEGTQSVLDSDGWLRTGDVVEKAPNGEIRVIDRKKAIIITSGGKNIAPSEMENALKESMYIREVIIVGEARHFVSALIQIDMDAVGKWAQEQGLAYTNYRSLARLPEVRELVAGVVNGANERFAKVARVRKFVILDKELDHDDGELTATQKVKRAFIEVKFAKEIASIYGGPGR